jgi:hypothetical protein
MAEEEVIAEKNALNPAFGGYPTTSGFNVLWCFDLCDEFLGQDRRYFL